MRLQKSRWVRNWAMLPTIVGMVVVTPLGAAFADDAAQTATEKAASSSADQSQPGEKSAAVTSTAKTPSDENKKESDEKKKETAKPEEKKPERRLVTVSGNRTTLNVEQWPLLGKKDAKYIFVEMFDYTCPHCQATHRALLGARQQYGDDLAVIALPVSIHGTCTADGSYQSESCEIARISVAVWRVDATRFEHFHSWLFESSYARSSAEARQYAAQLVGEKKLSDELAQPWAGKYIVKHVELYQRAGGGSVPKLLFPKATIVGEVGSTSTLCDLIKRELETK